jgi:hypothetical protein
MSTRSIVNDFSPSLSKNETTFFSELQGKDLSVACVFLRSLQQYVKLNTDDSRASIQSLVSSWEAKQLDPSWTNLFVNIHLYLNDRESEQLQQQIQEILPLLQHRS